MASAERGEKRSFRILLIRHAKTQGYSKRNTPLSQLGVQQAIHLGQFVLSQHSVDAVVTSPLLRALQTTCIALGAAQRVARANPELSPPSEAAAASAPPAKPGRLRPGLERRRKKEAAAAAKGRRRRQRAEEAAGVTKTSGVSIECSLPPLGVAQPSGIPGGSWAPALGALGCRKAAKGLADAEDPWAVMRLHGATESAASQQTSAAEVVSGAWSPPVAAAEAVPGTVPVVVTPLVRETICSMGDVGQSGSTLLERLEACISHAELTEPATHRSGGCELPDTLPSGGLQALEVTPWCDSGLRQQLLALPRKWWLTKEQRGGEDPQPGAVPFEPKEHAQARAEAFRRALRKFPPGVKTVAVIAHGNWLRRFYGQRRSWDFTQVRELTVQV